MKYTFYLNTGVWISLRSCSHCFLDSFVVILAIELVAFVVNNGWIAAYDVSTKARMLYSLHVVRISPHQNILICYAHLSVDQGSIWGCQLPFAHESRPFPQFISTVRELVYRTIGVGICKRLRLEL